jgi:hypothetical protein
LFAEGVFTWGHIRALTLGARRLDVTTRQSLDTYLGAQAGRLGRLDADGRLGIIDDAVVLHTRPQKVEERAERTPADNVVVLTPRLDGTGTLFSDLDPEGFATVTRRLHDEAGTPLAPPSPGDDADGLPAATRTDTTAGIAAGNTAGVAAGEHRLSRGRQLADALVRIFARHDRAPGAGAPVRFAVLVDADRVADQIAGTIQGAVAGRAPRLTARALDRLACDAAFDVIVRRGTDLIAAQRYAPELTAATRRAVAARDQGCRFPSCQAPASWCDIHHVVPRAAKGDHALRNLVLLCRRHHTIVHRRGWEQTLDDAGEYRIRRNRRTWTTRPRTPLPTSTRPPTADRVPSASGRDPTPAGPPGSSRPPLTTNRRTADGRPTRPVTGPAPPEPLPF